MRKSLCLLLAGIFLFGFSSHAYDKYVKKGGGGACIGIARIKEGAAPSRTHAEFYAIEKATDEFNECVKNKYEGKRGKHAVYIGSKKIVVYDSTKMTSSEAAKYAN